MNYSCKYCCDDNFDSENSLRSHLNVNHLRWLPFKCYYCPLYKPTRSEIVDHLEKRHPDQLIVESVNRENEMQLEDMIQECCVQEMDHLIGNPGRGQGICRSPGDDLSIEMQQNSQSGVIVKEEPYSPKSPKRQNSTSNFCTKCEKTVKWGKINHVQGHHLSKHIFKCPYCTYGSRFSRSHVVKHISALHPGKSCENVKDFRARYRLEVERLVEQLFVDHKSLDQRKRGGARSRKSDAGGPGLAKNGKSKIGKETLTSLRAEKSMFCSKCKITVAFTSGRVQHIYRHHLMEPIFLCPYCTYGTRFSASQVLRHISRMHPDEPPVVKDSRWKYQKDVERLTRELFGSFGEDNSEILKGSISSTSSEIQNSRRSKIFKYTPCQKCQMQVKTVPDLRRNHIYTFHFEENIYWCPYCKFGSRSNKANVKGHMRAKHPEKPHHVIDVRAEKCEKLEKLFGECFGAGNIQEVDNVSTTPPNPRNIKREPRSSPDSLTDLVTCSGCQSEIFNSPYWMSRHIFKQHLSDDANAYGCPLCKRFKSKNSLIEVKNHIRWEHPNDEMPADERLSEGWMYEAEVRCLGKVLFGRELDLSSVDAFRPSDSPPEPDHEEEVVTTLGNFEIQSPCVL